MKRHIVVALGMGLLFCSMPAGAPPLVAAVIGYAAASAVGLTVGTLAFAAFSGAVSFVANMVLTGFMGSSPDAGTQQSQPTYQSEARDRLQVVRSAVETRRIIYGQVMVSGPLVYAQSTGASSEFLHLVIPLASHECEEIGDVYLNDEVLGPLDGSGTVTTGRYTNLVRVKKHLGTTSQAADDDLVAASDGLWTVNHRLRGIAYIYVRLQFDRDAFPLGIPNIKALVKGKKLYDPRTELTIWSDNWALCVRDYLAGSYGLSCSSAEIDDDSVIASANVCDELIELEAGSPVVTQKRYTANGTVNLADSPRDIMKDLLTAGAGACVYTQGVYRVFAGAYREPNENVIDESWLRGGLEVRPRPPRRELYNAVRGTFSNPDKFWQPTDFPPVTNALYEEQDGDQQIMRDIELPFTTDVIRAQRIAKIHLEKSRQGISASLECNLKAFAIAVWDTVKVSIDRLGWDEKVFIVTGWTFNENGGVDLQLQEEAAEVYDWNFGDATILDPAPDTVLPSPFDVEPPGALTVTEELYETTGSAGVKARAIVSWIAAPSIFIDDYVVEFRVLGDGDYKPLPLFTATSAVLDDVKPEVYEFRVKARNSLGVSSDWATKTQAILGLTASPVDVTGFSVIKVGGVALATWDLSPDLDVQINGLAVIRHSSLTTGATWNDGVVLDSVPGGAVQAFLPLVTGTYLIKFVDSSVPGNYSETAASFVVTEGMVTAFTTVATSTQAPTFTGTKTNTVVSSESLMLDEVGGGSSDVLPSGSYAFSSVMDLTTIATRRFEADVTVLSFYPGAPLFDADEMFDSGELFDDSGSGDINDCDATLYAAVTNDDPTGTPTWTDWAPFFVADFTCRAAKFRLDLESGSADHNIMVSELTVHAKVPA